VDKGVAPPGLSIISNGFPDLPVWANSFRASGARSSAFIGQMVLDFFRAPVAGFHFPTTVLSSTTSTGA